MARNNITHIRPLNGGGEPPEMDQRIRQLEHDMGIVKETMATRDGLNGVRLEIQSVRTEVQNVRTELYQALSSQTWKIMTAIIASMSLMTAIFAAVVKWL